MKEFLVTVTQSIFVEAEDEVGASLRGLENIDNGVCTREVFITE